MQTTNRAPWIIISHSHFEAVGIPPGDSQISLNIEQWVIKGNKSDNSIETREDWLLTPSVKACDITWKLQV
jgi:hypothetical protein